MFYKGWRRSLDKYINGAKMQVLRSKGIVAVSWHLDNKDFLLQHNNKLSL